MPNWCLNVITVTGKEDKVEEFKSALYATPAKYYKEKESDYNTKKRYTMNGIVPVPKEILEAGYYNSDIDVLDSFAMMKGDKKPLDGYHWQIVNWGVKWDLSMNVEVEKHKSDDDNYELIIRTETAWSPIVPFIEKASGKYPELDFEIYFEETGNLIIGHSKYRNGVCYQCVHSDGSMSGYIDYQMLVEGMELDSLFDYHITEDDEWCRDLYQMIKEAWLQVHPEAKMPTYEDVIKDLG